MHSDLSEQPVIPPTRIRRLALLLVLLGLVNAPLAFAGPTRQAGPVKAISGASPYDKSCGAGGEGPSEHAEVEPHVAVNPTDSDNIIAAWQQDRFGEGGGSRGNVVAVSRDGGIRWKKVLVPEHSGCTGGLDRATDPWLSFGPDGTAYFASFVYDGLRYRLLVSHSEDGGSTWETVVAHDRLIGLTPDKEAVTADTHQPGHAYLVWLEVVEDPATQTFFSRTTDGGRTWSPARPIHPIVGRGAPVGNQIVVLKDGTLLDVFTYVVGFSQGPPTESWTFMASRSEDKGETWSTPVEIAEIPGRRVQDPETGQPLRTEDLLASVAMSPKGIPHVVWQEIKSDHRARVVFSRSTDGGVTWDEGRPVVAARGQVFNPTVAFAADGTMGVSYYDFRRNRLGDRALTTDVWFAHSHGGGRSWSEAHLGGPFDFRAAPRSSRGWFLGDYFGLAPLGDDLVAVFVMAQPAADKGATDVFFRRLDL